MNKLMKTFTISAVALGAVVLPQLGHAEGIWPFCCNAHDQDGPYASVKGGWTDTDDHSYNTGVGLAETKLKNGALGSAAMGYKYGVMRYEAEVLHQESDAKSHTIGGVTPGGVDGSPATTAAMANAYVDLGTYIGLKPYVGGGVGYSRVKFKDYRTASTGTFLDDSDNVLAYQGMAGVSYDITPKLALTGEYRYLGTNDPEVTTVGGTNTKISNDSNNGMLGLRYTF